MEQLAIETRVSALENELEEAKEKIEALIIANNAFRTAMLARNDPPTVDQIYLAKSKNTWASFDISVLMQFYELFSAHAQIFTDLVKQKRGQNAIADHLLAKAAANAAEVRAFNERGETKKAAKAAKAPAGSNGLPEVSDPDKNKKKAIQGIMKALGLTEAAARAMLDKSALKA